MPRLKDGTVVSSYFSVGAASSGADIKDQGMKTLIGQVEKVHFTDDATNVSKKFVEYDVSVRDEKGGQTTLQNVRQMNKLGGTNDYEETILEPNAFAFTGKLDTSNIFTNKNGTLVYIDFRDGSFDKPYISGCIPHPKKVGAKKADGIRMKGEFRGFNWNIDKDGNVLLVVQGAKTPAGKDQKKDVDFSIIHQTGALCNVDKDGSINLVGSDGGYMFLNADKGEASIVSVDGHLLSMASKGVTLATGDGKTSLTMTADGVQMITGGDMNLQPAGNFSVSSGAVTLTDSLMGTIKIKSGGIKITDLAMGSLNIKNGMVALGGPAAELLDLFDQLLTALSTLMTSLSSSAATAGPFPVLPPIALATAPATVSITLIQTLLALIKGSL